MQWMTRWGRKKIVIAATCVAIVLTTAMGLWWHSRYSNPIPQTNRNGLGFTLHYPSRLPNGYQVDRNSFQNPEPGVLTFSISAPDGRKAAISEAALPLSLPEHKKVTSLMQIPGETVYDSPIGSVKISVWKTQYVSDIITKDSWIIINVTGFTFEEAKTISNSLEKL